MGLGCTAYAFSIRKRKRLREKRCRPGKFFFVGEKKKEEGQKKCSEEFCLSSDGKGTGEQQHRRADGADRCPRTVAADTAGFTCGSNCPVAGVECSCFPSDSPVLSQPPGCQLRDGFAVPCGPVRRILPAPLIPERCSGARRAVQAAAVSFAAFLCSPQLLHLRQNLSLHLLQ